MIDLAVPVPVPGGASGLARVARVMGAAGVDLEGGGMWGGVAHYLVADGSVARAALEDAGLQGAVARPALLVDLEADVPGALGRLLERLEAAGVGLEAQYSDHRNRKVLVVDDVAVARRALAPSS